MNARELKTWNALCSLDFDLADAALPFSARLARDNGWSGAFAGQAIEEYRKFCFLAVHAGHPVTPSDEVDQVWHLHLLYSRHYWDTLCRDALDMPLHHGPTKGGGAEAAKYCDWYERTLASYRRYFGDPPRKLWPLPAERFDAAHDYVRVDRRDAIVVDRRLIKRGLISSVAGAGALTVAHALAQAEGASSSNRGVVFWLLAAVVLIAMIVAVRRAPLVRGKTRRKRRTGGAGGAACGGCATSGGKSSPNQADAGGGAADGSAGASGCGGGGGGCGGGCGS